MKDLFKAFLNLKLKLWRYVEDVKLLVFYTKVGTVNKPYHNIPAHRPIVQIRRMKILLLSPFFYVLLWPLIARVSF